MKAIAVSHKGKRAVNQDLIFEYTANDGSYLFVVIDGMGGYEKGETAAEIIRENFEAYLSTVDTIDKFHIQKAINKSNLAIRQAKSSLSANMGATIGGVLISARLATYFWVGDVKVFHFRNNKLLFESVPHNLVNVLIKNGAITEHSQLSRYKHVVTRSIHGDIKSCKAETNFNFFLPNTDLILVCSDGVHELFDSLQLENILSHTIKPSIMREKLESKLIRDANDNYSFGIITSNPLLD